MIEDSAAAAGLSPKGAALGWRPELVTIHLAAELLMFGAFAALALCVWRATRRRPEFRLHWIAALLGLFFLASSMAHLVGALSLAQPVHGAEGLLRLGAATLAVIAAATIWRLAPILARYPTIAELDERARVEAALREREIELESALAKAQTAERTKIRFFAAMSHDLRTPLNAIIGFAETLNMGVFGPLANPKQAEYVSDIHTSGVHLLSLINDLLHLSGNESGAYRVKPRQISVGEALSEVARQAETVARMQRCDIVVRVSQEVDTVEADPTALRRMLMNLLSNAIKYAPKSDVIDITVREGPESVEFTVTDDGPGLPEGRIEEMRAPFAREAESDDGLGIGLSIVDALMTLHSGAMRLGNAPGRGAQVTLSFPKSQPVEKAEPARSEESPTPPPSPDRAQWRPRP